MRPLLLCVALAVSFTASCGMIPQLLYGKLIAGQVVDADTGRPITGVHVALLWESTINPSGFTGHNSRTICYHAAAAVTDSMGHFKVEEWNTWSTYDVDNVDPKVLVYARNYAPRQIILRGGSQRPPTERLNERYELKPFEGAPDDRLHALFYGLANQGCMYGKESQKSLFPMLKAIYEEARGIATTRDQTGTVRVLAELAADAALAEEPNSPVNNAKTDAFIEEQLK